MKISIRNATEKVKPEELKEAVRFFADKLIPKVTQSRLNLSIIFDTDNKKLGKDRGQTIWDHYGNGDKNKFTIRVNPTLNRVNLLMTIAHEMVHVKQWATGELYDYKANTKARWHGEILETEDIDYWVQPWEIEAWGRETGLYLYYKDHHTEKTKAAKALARAKAKKKRG